MKRSFAKGLIHSAAAVQHNRVGHDRVVTQLDRVALPVLQTRGQQGHVACHDTVVTDVHQLGVIDKGSAKVGPLADLAAQQPKLALRHVAHDLMGEDPGDLSAKWP